MSVYLLDRYNFKGFPSVHRTPFGESPWEKQNFMRNIAPGLSLGSVVWLISHIESCGTITVLFISEASFIYLVVNEVGEIQFSGLGP